MRLLIQQGFESKYERPVALKIQFHIFRKETAKKNCLNNGKSKKGRKILILEDIGTNLSSDTLPHSQNQVSSMRAYNKTHTAVWCVIPRWVKIIALPTNDKELNDKSSMLKVPKNLKH